MSLQETEINNIEELSPSKSITYSPSPQQIPQSPDLPETSKSPKSPEIKQSPESPKLPLTTSSTSNMVKVSNILEDNGTMTFQIDNLNVSFINAIRRTILSDIPTVVFRTFPHEKNDAKFYKNTTRLHNEILKQRLSCIPIHINDLSIPLDDFVVEIKMKNDTDTIMYVTTKDFKIKNTKSGNYLKQSEVAKIFPADPYTKDHIIFARLRPKISDDIEGEELHIEAKMTISNADEDGMFNVVSTCSYSMTPDANKQNAEWNNYEKKIKSEEIYNEEDIEDIKKNWYLLDAKRFYKPDSFEFILKSIGVFDNNEIMKKACNILIKKIDDFISVIDSQTIEIKDAETVMTSFDIVLENEDYTLGKVFEYGLHKKYYEDDMVFDFVGFRKLHPHDNHSIIRVSFANNNGNKDALYGYLKDVAIYTKTYFQNIKNQF